jgi:hypothetical protein
MSVKIEVLDYKYSTGINLVDCFSGQDDGLSVGVWTVDSKTKMSWQGNYSSSTNDYFNYITPFNLQAGKTYNLSFKIAYSFGSGNMGFSASNVSATSTGIGSTFRTDALGITTFNDTFTALIDFKPRLFAKGSNAGTIEDIKITEVNSIDWENSIVGELDISDHNDFPLALTFQISDIQKITSASGNYSKTFKIPATKHNNNLLKNLYVPNSIHETAVTAMKKCRIIVNDLYSLEGLLQVSGVGGYGERCSYYNCVFYGNNVSWAGLITNSSLNEVDWGTNPDEGGTKLLYTRGRVKTSWSQVDCNSTSSYLVYPVTSYGQYNADGEGDTIQLLDTHYGHYGATTSSDTIGYYGWNNSGNHYGTPLPSPDWRPCLWVKDTLELIFKQHGYLIDSDFMDTSIFKKLVWALPNFKYHGFNVTRRFEQHSIIGTMDEGTISTQNPTQTAGQDYLNGKTYWSSYAINPSTGTGTITFQGQRLGCGADNCTGSSYGYNDSNGKFTAAEYGYYKIRMTGFSARMDDLNYTPDSGASCPYFRLKELYVRIGVTITTVGQTSISNYIWGDVVHSSIYLGSCQFGGNASSGSVQDTVNFALPTFEERVWLNQGDTVKMATKIRYETANQYYEDDTFEFDFYVGNEYGANASNSSSYSIEFEPEIVEWGQEYDIGEVIDPSFKQLDFVKGIAHAFNLKISTDEEKKTVRFEPFDSFYKPFGEAIDWTYKVDRSKESQDKFLKTDVKRKLIFKYKEDSNDAKVKDRAIQYFDNIKDEYPYSENLSTDFEIGDSIFENPFFAGTFCGKDRASTGSLMNEPHTRAPYGACLWTENVSTTSSERPEKGFDFVPRLLYYNKYSPAMPSNTALRFARIQSWDGTIETVKANSNATTGFTTHYPQATSYNREKTDSPNLCYGNVNVTDYDDVANTFSAQTSVDGLYNTYYKNMIEMIKSNPRMRTTHIALNMTDIVNLDFSKLVYIDGVYWRINRIVDFQPNKNQSTKVELVEWMDIGTVT